MIANRSRRGKRSRGQALVEFALAAPIFFTLVFGLIELGRAVYYVQVLDSAARDGARYGVVHGFESFCPSGPLPGNPPPANTCDPIGTNVINTVVDRSFGVSDKSTNLVVGVKWCNAKKFQTDPPDRSCGEPQDIDQVPCGQWTGVNDLGGDNNRGQIVTVCVSYSYEPLLGSVVPIPDFTVTGRATLVVNH